MKNKIEQFDKKMKIRLLFLISLLLIGLRSLASETEIDVAKLYKSSQDDLKEQKEIVQTLNQNIEDKNKELKEKLKSIDEQKKIISEQTKDIKAQEDKIKNQTLQLNKQIAEIEEQKRELEFIYSNIEEQRQKLLLTEQEIIDKEKIFEETKINLDALIDKINEQKNNIILQDEAIKKQKNIIIIFSILLVAILSLIINDIRQKRKLKATNKKIDSMLIELQELHESVKSSIEYAGIIQSSLISSPEVLKSYFKESFAVWQAKDTVGGDIYIFEEINENECLLFLIDCTGHGVPGALGTVLVKAIERNIVANIVNGKDKDISPASLLGIFNRSIKHLLKQNSKDNFSNVGFDGSILYYNRLTQELRFASSNTVIMHLRDKEIKEYKGDRQSIGYKTSSENYEYKEQTIRLENNDVIFVSSDGLYDQNGGVKDLPMGRRKIREILIENSDETLNDIKELILYELGKYQGKNRRNDDISFLSFKI